MDQKELQEKIALYYSKLPPNAQELFASMAWLETLRTISQKYGLNDKQIETLGTETTLVLLGIIHLVEYEEALTKELELSQDVTDKILGDIEELIIKPIRPQLVQAFETNTETEQKPTPQEELSKRMQNLPEEIKKILKESNYQATLYQIIKGYNLTVTQMGFVETAVTDLIVGAIRPEEFEGFLKKNLTAPAETVTKLVNELNEKIFLKIREALKKMSPKEEVDEDSHVLSTAGIEIIPQNLELAKGHIEHTSENREDIIKKIEIPETVRPMSTPTPVPVPPKPTTEETHPTLVQKLSGSFKIPAVKTDHSLGNLSSKNTLGSIAPKVDPYREVPE